MIKIVRTPLIPAVFGGQSSLPIFLKPENLQPFGSYKIRGVFEAVKQADPLVVAQGLVTASAGNMAQAVAFVASQMNLKCQIFVPDTAPEIKKDAIRSLGATLVERPYSEIWSMVTEESYRLRAQGLFIHPVFTPGLQSGYGTIATEILADLPDVSAVVVPFGVGGLTLGIAKSLRAHGCQAEIYACEPETATPLHASLKAGRATAIERVPSFVDAIGTPEVLPAVFSEASTLVRGSIVVSLTQARQAVAALALRHKLICEGAGAASFAAAQILAERQLLDQRQRPGPIVCILSGGNIKPETLHECISAGPAC